MAFQLPPLPYPSDALEPFIDKQTMEIHHGKHHAAYVTNLNKALEQAPDLQNKSVVSYSKTTSRSCPMRSRPRFATTGADITTIRCSGCCSIPKKPNGKPTGNSAKAIDSAFGSFDSFKEKFIAAATTRFGSGWAWLVKNREKLEVLLHRQSGQPADGRQISDIGPRCVGTRLLFEVSEPPAGLHRGMVEHRELERSRKPVQ